MSIATVALVSIGIHPASGRLRRAEQDARAVELGLELAGDNLHVLHAGNPHEPALRAYLGMGLDELHVLEQPDGADAVPRASTASAYSSRTSARPRGMPGSAVSSTAAGAQSSSDSCASAGARAGRASAASAR